MSARCARSFASRRLTPTLGTMSNLAIGEQGPFAELSRRPNPERHALVYVPALAALLERAKQLKGAELSEKQVERIASNATVICMNAVVAEAFLKQRGYE